MRNLNSVSRQHRLRQAKVLSIIVILITTYFYFTDSVDAPLGNELTVEPIGAPLSVASMELVSTIKADSDDDYWNQQDGVWTHNIA